MDFEYFRLQTNLENVLVAEYKKKMEIRIIKFIFL